MDARQPDDSRPHETGLDARLDKDVPNSVAAGFLMAGDGSQPGRVFPLTRNTSIIGRSEKADVRISQPAVSNEHARIINGPLGFEVEDMGSVNGTFVNGARIARARLQKGDRLTLGNVEFTFLSEKNAEATMALLPAGRRATGGMTMRAPGAMSAAADEDTISLQELTRRLVSIYEVLRPYFPMAMRLTGIGMALGLASTLAFPPLKTAICETRLHSAKKSNPVDTESRQEQDPIQFFVDAERSFALPGVVASTLEKLNNKPPSPDMVGKIASRLRLELVGERLYRASYREPAFPGDDPPSIKLLDTQVKTYIETDIERALKALDNETKFLNEKLAIAVADLTKTNNALAEFKKENADDLPETSEQAHSSRYYLDTRKGELMAQIAKLAGELAVDAAQMNEGNPAAQSKFQSSQVYRTSQQDLKRRLSEAYARGLADGHPEVQQMKSEMARLQKVIDQEMRSETSEIDKIADPAFVGLKAKVGVERAQLHAAQIELQEVERNLERAKKAVITMPAVAAKLDDLQRQYDGQKRLHDQLSAQAQKATLQLDVERVAAQSRYEIVTPTFLARPTTARTLVNRGALGFGLGLVLVIFLVLYREGSKFVSRTLASSSPRR